MHASELYGERGVWAIEPITFGDITRPAARTLAESALPQAYQEEGIRSIAPAAKPSTGVVTSRSTATAMAVYEDCASVSYSTRAELKSIKGQEKSKGQADRSPIGLLSLVLQEAVLCAIRVLRELRRQLSGSVS
eukprot:IDg8381t1